MDDTGELIVETLEILSDEIRHDTHENWLLTTMDGTHPPPPPAATFHMSHIPPPPRLHPPPPQIFGGYNGDTLPESLDVSTMFADAGMLDVHGLLDDSQEAKRRRIARVRRDSRPGVR